MHADLHAGLTLAHWPLLRRRAQLAQAAQVESRSGAVTHHALRLPSPLIKPDVPISGIRLSDWFHPAALGIGPT